jgi:primosomal protein N' (replication factor Y)
MYPPFVRMARVLFRDPSPEKAQAAAERATAHIQEILKREGAPPTQLTGPAPAFFAKSNNVYRWQLLVKSADPTLVLRHFDPPPGAYVDVDPMDVL